MTIWLFWISVSIWLYFMFWVIFVSSVNSQDAPHVGVRPHRKNVCLPYTKSAQMLRMKKLKVANMWLT